LRNWRSKWVQLFAISFIKCISFHFKFLAFFWSFVYILVLCWTGCCVTVLRISEIFHDLIP
jgi:hypothetical protein